MLFRSAGPVPRGFAGRGLGSWRLAAAAAGGATAILTGKYRTAADLQKSPRGAGVGQKYLNEKGLALLPALDAVANRQQATPAQVALAWLMQAPGVTAPIASATSVGQVTELLEATELRLTAEDVETLESARPVPVVE